MSHRLGAADIHRPQGQVQGGVGERWKPPQLAAMPNGQEASLTVQESLFISWQLS